VKATSTRTTRPSGQVPRPGRSVAGVPVPGRRPLSASVRHALIFVAPLIALVVIWGGVKYLFGLSDDVLVSPAATLRSATELVRQGILPAYISASLWRITLGGFLAMVIGVPVGLGLGVTRYGARMFEPFLRFFQGISGIAWLPLAIVWFGFTNVTIQVAILYTALVPVVFNTLIGVQLIPDIYKESIQTMGGGRLHLVRDVYLPGALPSIVVGLRLGIGYGWRALIAGEILTGLPGLGTLIFEARRFHQIDQILAGMVVIGVLYLIVDRMVLAPVERLTVQRWGVIRA